MNHIDSDPWGWQQRAVAHRHHHRHPHRAGADRHGGRCAAQGSAPACPTATPRPTRTPTPTPQITAVGLVSFDAAPAKVCTAWRVEKSCCKTILGVRVCACFKLTCVKPSAKIAGLAAPAPGAGLCVCTVGAKSFPCALRFERIGVRWFPVRACIPPHAGKVSGLAAPALGNGSGCVLAARERNVACTVEHAGPGWAFGPCAGGLFFMGQTPLILMRGEPVKVTGCRNNFGTLFSARDWPLRISR